MPRPCRNPECPYTIPDNSDPKKVDCDYCIAKSRRWVKKGPGAMFKWHRRLKLSDSIVVALLPDEKLKEDAKDTDILKYRQAARDDLSKRPRARKQARR